MCRIEIPDFDIKVIAGGVEGKEIDEIEKAVYQVRREISLIYCPTAPHGVKVRRLLFVDKSMVSFWRERLQGCFCGFEIVPIPNGLSLAGVRNYVEKYGGNPGSMWMSDYDLKDVRRNGSGGESYLGNGDDYEDAIAVSKVMVRAMYEQVDFGITLSTFPWRVQSWPNATNSGNTSPEARSKKPYMPRGIMLISAKSKSAGTFQGDRYLEDLSRVLEEGLTGCPARSDVGLFVYEQSEMLDENGEYPPKWYTAHNYLVGKYEAALQKRYNEQAAIDNVKGSRVKLKTKPLPKNWVYNLPERVRTNMPLDVVRPNVNEAFVLRAVEATGKQTE